MSQVKVMTVLGTRPEIPRQFRIIPALDTLCKHVLVHTGQNFDPQLSDVFFAELGIRNPDHYLDVPVYHLEAGNRCFDDRVPEEINRRIIDQCSDVLLPYTERSGRNLLQEGFPVNRIYVIGNPIHEVMNHYRSGIEESDIMRRLDLEPRGYFLVTMHRAENVDVEERLRSLAESLEHVQREFGVRIICSLHPHTRKRMEQFSVVIKSDHIRLLQPLSLFDFITLERNASCVLTDSGILQEECCIFKIPTVTVRDTTERPETLECGSNILSGVEPSDISRCIRVMLSRQSAWEPPPEYLREDVSSTVVRLLLGEQSLVQLQKRT